MADSYLLESGDRYLLEDSSGVYNLEPAGTVALSDDFNRADGGLGVDWVSTTGVSQNQISGGQVIANPTTPGTSTARHITPCTTEYQFAEMDWKAASVAGPAVCMPFYNSGAAQSAIGAFYQFRRVTDTAVALLRKESLSTTYTVLQQVTVSTLTEPTRFRLTWDGGTLRGFVNGVEIATHTPAFPIQGNKYVGFSHGSSNSGALGDNWAGGDIVPVARRWNFEVAPTGTNLNTSNLRSDDNAVPVNANVGAGSTLTSDSSRALEGTYSARFAHATSTAGTMRFPFSYAHHDGAVEFYHYLDAAVSISYPFMSLRQSSGQALRMQVTPAGALEVIASTGGAVLATTATGVVSYGTWMRYRLTYRVSGTNSAITIRAYVGDSSTEAGSAVAPSVNAAVPGPILAAEFGSPQTVATAHTQWFDGVVMESGQFNLAVGKFSFTGAATGLAPVGGPPGAGTADGTLAYSGSAIGAREPKATSVGTFNFAGTATGKRTPTATATGTFSFAGVATGKRTPKATSSGTFSYVGAASGTAPVIAPKTGTAAGTFSYAGVATGKRIAKATTTGAFAFAGTASGKRIAQATASGAFSFAGAATGKRIAKASPTGTFTFSGAATGKRSPKATASGTFAYVGTAVGKRAPKATAATSTAWTGTAVGDVPPNRATAAGTFSFTGVATARTIRRGTGSGTFTYTGSATGNAPLVGAADGTATGSFSYVGTASGKRSPKATAAGLLAWAGTATGKRAPKGSVSRTWSFAGVATGKRTPKATAAGTYSYSGAAAGKRVAKATGSGTYAYTGVAVGKRSPRATATTLTTWNGTAVGKRVTKGITVGTTTYIGTTVGRRRPKGSAISLVTWTGTALGTSPVNNNRRGVATGTVVWVSTAIGDMIGVPGDLHPEIGKAEGNPLLVDEGFGNQLVLRRSHGSDVLVDEPSRHPLVVSSPRVS